MPRRAASTCVFVCARCDFAQLISHAFECDVFLLVCAGLRIFIPVRFCVYCARFARVFVSLYVFSIRRALAATCGDVRQLVASFFQFVFDRFSCDLRRARAAACVFCVNRRVLCGYAAGIACV